MTGNIKWPISYQKKEEALLGGIFEAHNKRQGVEMSIEFDTEDEAKQAMAKAKKLLEVGYCDKMDLIIGTRQSGKTTELIRRMMKDEKGLLIVPTTREKVQLTRYMGVPEERVAVFRELVDAKPRSSLFEKNLYVDRTNYILEMILRGPIKAATADSCNTMEMRK